MTSCECFKKILGLKPSAKLVESDISYKACKLLDLVAGKGDLENKVIQAENHLTWLATKIGIEPSSEHSCSSFKRAREEIKKLLAPASEPQVVVKWLGNRQPSHNLPNSFKIDVLKYTRHSYNGGKLRFHAKWRGFEAESPTMEPLSSALKAPDRLKAFIESLPAKSKATLLKRSRVISLFLKGEEISQELLESEDQGPGPNQEEAEEEAL